MKKLINRIFKGFTLVELIIVIAIIAILSVAAFLVVTKWIGKSRDARRLSDVGTMVRSVTLYKIEKGNVPMPSGSISTGEIVTLAGPQKFSFVGTFGSETVGELDSLQKVPTDPMVEGKEYIYGVHERMKEFEVGVTLEGDEENAYVNSVFAVREKAKVDGNYKPRTVILTGNILKVIPSLLFVSEGGETKNIGAREASFIVDEGHNKPYSIYGEGVTMDSQDESVKLAVGNKEANYEGINLDTGSLTGILEGIRDVSGGEFEMREIIAFVKKNGFLSSYDEEEVEDGINEVLNGYKFEAPIVGVKVEYKKCGDTENGGTKKFYSEESVAYGNSCDNVKKIFTCEDGEWKDGENSADTGTYQYSMCSVEGAVNCSANSSYSYNSHTYDIVEIPHGSTENTTSSEVNENNGIFTYELSTTCDNGSYINENETGPTLVNCDSGYSQDGNSCIDNIPPSGGSFTINSGSTETSTSKVLLNISCPTDIHSPIQVAFGNNPNPTNWQYCYSKDYTYNLTDGEGEKTFYVRFRDSINNMTNDYVNSITKKSLILVDANNVGMRFYHVKRNTQQEAIDALRVDQVSMCEGIGYSCERKDRRSYDRQYDCYRFTGRFCSNRYNENSDSFLAENLQNVKLIK